jgi:hypothetical protein
MFRWLWEEVLGLFGVRRHEWGNPKDAYNVVRGPGVLLGKIPQGETE